METKKSTFALFFYINKSRQNQQGQCPVYLRITVNNTQTAVSIKRSIHPENWNKQGFPKGKSDEAKDLNNYINILRNKLFTIQEELVLKENFINADMFRMALFGANADKGISLLELLQERIDTEKNLYEKGKKSISVYMRFESIKKHLEQYLNQKFHLKDILVRRADKEFIKGFISFMELTSLSHNYVVKLMSRLKSVFEIAVEKDLISKNPFYGIAMTMEDEEERNFLTEDELHKLLNSALTDPDFERERDMFCFSVFTGLANIDVCELTRGKLQKMNGQWWIHVSREKTNVLSNIPLLPQAEQIIRKYNPDFENLTYTQTLLPMKNVCKRNYILKKIAGQCGIGKKLTTHVARHTFATTITLSNDVPLETVSKMLGHKSLRMTQHYAKIVDKKIGRDMETLTSKISGTYQLQV